MTLLLRESLTIEAIFSLFQGTFFNPFLTGPLSAVLLYFPYQVQSVLPRSIRHYVTTTTFLWTLRTLVGYGAIRTLNNYLSRMVLNNWTRDSWRHGKEIVLATGGGGGIGEAVVRGLSASSAHVVAIDLFPPKKPFPSNVQFYKLDVTNPTEIGAVAKEFRKAYGSPTVVINNAGISILRPILNQTDDQLQRIFNVNTLAHFRIIKEFLPDIAKANHGHVVMVTSMYSYFVGARNVDYTCTKASALAFHQGLGQELKFVYNAPKVRTTIVNLTYVRTPMLQLNFENAAWKKKKHFVIEPETVADAIVKQLHSGMGGQIVLPGRYLFATTIGAWPAWMQESLRNMMGKESAWLGDKGRLRMNPIMRDLGGNLCCLSGKCGKPKINRPGVGLKGARF